MLLDASCVETSRKVEHFSYILLHEPSSGVFNIALSNIHWSKSVFYYSSRYRTGSIVWSHTTGPVVNLYQDKVGCRILVVDTEPKFDRRNNIGNFYADSFGAFYIPCADYDDRTVDGRHFAPSSVSSALLSQSCRYYVIIIELNLIRCLSNFTRPIGYCFTISHNYWKLVSTYFNILQPAEYSFMPRCLSSRVHIPEWRGQFFVGVISTESWGH